MPTSRAMKVAVDRRRAQVADLYLQRWTQVQIAERLGVTQGTVSMDLRAVRKDWRQSSIRDFDLAREEELRKIDRVEREAWDAWERSKKPQQEATVEGEPPHQKTRKRVRNQNGDPRCLEIVRSCTADRRALLGLDAPTKTAFTTPDGKALSFEQKKVIVQNILVQQFGLAAVRDSEEEFDHDAEGNPSGSENGSESLGELPGARSPVLEHIAELPHRPDYSQAPSTPT